MKNKKERADREQIDILKLKKYGLTNQKISKMFGVPIEKVNQYFREQEKFRHYSGVF